MGNRTARANQFIGNRGLTLLTGHGSIAKERAAMHKVPMFAASIAALALLAACNTQPTTITAGGPSDPTANEIAEAPPVKLPPAVLVSKSYRCKDNSIVYIDYMNDSVSVHFRAKKDAMPTTLTAPAAGQPFVGDGIELTGSPDAKAVTVKNGGATKTCDA